MKYQIDYGELLCLLLDTFVTFSRRDVGWVLAGFRGTGNQRTHYEIIRRMEREGLVQRQGRGAAARFTITVKGRQRAVVCDPAREWARSWDKQWRVVSYDLPETRRRERRMLWRALRDRKLGFLQRSLWVWTHQVEVTLREIIEVEGVPECFCGFEAHRVFLCTDAEIVATAWDFEEIHKRQQMYLNQLVATPARAKAAQQPAELARLARLEHQSYQHAFSLDPLLPRVLWPKEYLGPAVEKRHQEFRSAFHRRRRQLARE